MLDTKKSENSFLKYALIILTAFLLSFAAAKIGLVNWTFVIKGMNYYLQNWTQPYKLVPLVMSIQYAGFIIYYLCCATLLMLLALVLIVCPSVSIVILLLYFLKKDWLPNNDPYLLKLLLIVAEMVTLFYSVIGLTNLLKYFQVI